MAAIPQADSRRKKKRRHSDSHDWDSSSDKKLRSSRGEKRQMFWMLVGGGGLFSLIVAGVLIAMLGGDKPDASGISIAPTPKPDPATVPVVVAKSDVTILAELEPLAKKFLEATRIEEILPLIRNPKIAGARLWKLHADGRIAAPGMADFNTQSELAHLGAFVSVNVRTRDFEEKPLVFFDTADGMKIDWESWAGWSEMPWEEFLETKPAEAKTFRLNLSPVEYYNIDFSDDKKWQSYRLTSPDGKHAIYGYAERGSALNTKLIPPPDVKQTSLMLALKFPENAASTNQVIIERFVAAGWVLETEESP